MVYLLNLADNTAIGVVRGFVPARRFTDLLTVRRRLNDLTKVHAAFGGHDDMRLVTYIASRMPS